MILALFNQKGGVGKTTSAINIAAALALLGDTVTIIDADRQAQSLDYDIESVDIIAAQDSKFLQKSVKAAKTDWVVIDCPPSLIEAAPAVPLADIILAPVPPRYQDLSGFAQLRETVDAARERGNPGLLLKILITMRDARVTLQSEYEQQIRLAFGSDVLDTVIPRAALFEKASSAHQSVIHYAPSSPSAKAYLALANELKNVRKELS